MRLRMELLTLEKFIPLLEPFANKEHLSPAESIQLTLLITEILVDNHIDFKLLKFLSRYFTQQSFDDVIEERNIEHQCGYVLCNNQPKSLVRRLSLNSNGTTTAQLSDFGASTRYQIYNRKPSIILPNTYLSQFCCKEHYQASTFYRNQLSNEALFTRKNITVIPPFEGGRMYFENSITLLEEVLAKHKELKEQGRTMAEVIAMMNGLSIDGNEMNDETNKLIKIIEDFEIVEKEPESQSQPVMFRNSNNNNRLFEVGDEATSEEDHSNGDDLAHRRIEGYASKSLGSHVV
ncbi:uncharacterized protein LODBEIA_P42850 [Lodderomyces beijingensis]|uniref:RNA polymerase II subunit B1 CTD phosphatase RPAP2 homolog n=1 Tax=Lodderomyces beijingensis TaxID=1775926 RepID=A0ABP0ZPG8_9ASCO